MRNTPSRLPDKLLLIIWESLPPELARRAWFLNRDHYNRVLSQGSGHCLLVSIPITGKTV
jgi:hypothetical protein